MKKTFLYSFALSVLGIGVMVFSASAVVVTTTANLDGELIKGTSYQTVYYLAEDGKRYVFPNSKTYFSWFDDFSTVREIPDEELFTYPLGGNVRYKPGSLLVKITTDPKVYAVGQNGKLRWIKSEKAAKALYGDNWNKLVDDIPDSFFTNYETGADIEDETDYDPTEVEQEIPTISHNRGFKVKEIIKNRVENLKERQCNRLEEAVNKLQKRAEKYGMEIEGVGDDFVTECIEKSEVRKNKKVKICHEKEDGKLETLDVAPARLRNLLHKRATLGECEDEENESSESGIENEDLEDDNSSSDDETEDSDISSDDETGDTGTSTDSGTGDTASSTDSGTGDTGTSTDSSAI